MSGVLFNLVCIRQKDKGLDTSGYMFFFCATFILKHEQVSAGQAKSSNLKGLRKKSN